MTRSVRSAFVCAALVGFSSFAHAQPKASAGPAPKMEPDKIGPQTEPVDVKAYATVLHVASSGAASGDGSKGKPFASIAQAVAKTGDATAEKRCAVLVAAGEYKGATIEMKSHVDLFGGFDAANWQRDIVAHASTLDGEGQRRVVVGADHARIDGFVICNGKVREAGAGILCDYASPTISNNIVIRNATLEPEGLSGRKMMHQHGNDGAGIACVNGSVSVIANNIIAHNQTDIGGGAGIAVANYSMPHILNNVIVNNDSGVTDVNGSRSSNGAAISATNAQRRPPLQMRVINNVIANNKTGPQSKSDAGGIYLEYDSSPVIGANWLVGNECADEGSALYVMKSSHPLFVGNIVAGNNSSAIRLSKEGRGDLENNLAFGNDAAVACVSSWMKFKNNTIVDNKSGVHYANSYSPHLKPSLITNNLIHGNGSDPLKVGGEEPPTMADNNVQGAQGAGQAKPGQVPQFAEDGVTGEARSVQYDEKSVTTAVAAGNLATGATLVGRVIRLGDRWGVIKSAADGRIVVWGDLRSKDQSPEFKIAPTYRLSKALPGDVGAK